jgi:hypothetical protein
MVESRSALRPSYSATETGNWYRQKKHEDTLERKVICRLYKMTPENKSGGYEEQSDQWPHVSYP